jgi:lipopolysaccharide export system permease protein
MSPLIYCLLAFGMVFIIQDLFSNLEDFIKAETPLLQVAEYYLLIQPALLIYIAPISLMLAVLYSLSQLTKNHEITAMRACGISLYRIVVPFMIVGFCVSLLTAVIHETIGPWAAWRTEQFISGEKHKGKREVHVVKNFPYKNEKAHRDWLFGRFDKTTHDLSDVRVTQQREDLSDEYKILAEHGQWLDGRWWFKDLSIQYYDLQGNPMGPPRYERNREMKDFTETPKEFLNEIKEPHLLSSLELRRYINSHKQFSERDLVKYRVDFYHRLAMPWTCLVVTLLGIPFGYTTGRKGAFVGIVLSICLFFAYYLLFTFCLGLGKQQQIQPWIAAWIPNILFVVLSLFMIRRMR